MSAYGPKQAAYGKARYEKNKEKYKADARRRYLANREAWIARSKKNYKVWAARNPARLAELKRSYANVRRYGITQDQFDEMFLQQDGKCAICEEPPKKRQLAIDHNHETGRVRQLLCVNCNAMLGHARENVRVLQRAMEYLRCHATLRIAS